MKVDQVHKLLEIVKVQLQHCSPAKSKTIETAYSASVSIDALLKAGKVAKPQPKNKVTFTCEAFNIKSREWTEVMEEELLVDTKKFASGAFRDAFHATGKKSAKNHQWVVKTYNELRARLKGLRTHQSRTTVANRCKCTQLQDTSQRNLNKKPHPVLVSVSNVTTVIIPHIMVSQQQLKKNMCLAHLSKLSIMMASVQNHQKEQVISASQ